MEQCNNVVVLQSEDEIKEHSSFDYFTLCVPRSELHETITQYEAFGWTAKESGDGDEPEACIEFKRSKNVKYKEKLQMLQIRFEDCKNAVKNLKERKFTYGICFAMNYGTVGALLLGGGLSLCIGIHLVWQIVLGVFMCVIGLGMCITNYALYRVVVKRCEKVYAPRVERKQGEAEQILQEAKNMILI